MTDGPSGSGEVAIQNPARYDRASDLTIWTRRLLAELSPERAALGLLLTGDDEIAEMNERFRSKSGPTDVLSFPGGDAESGSLGDIAISIPTASAQAELYGHSLERELKILVLHGVLHCLGHDHETDDGEMAALERELVGRWVVEERSAPAGRRE